MARSRVVAINNHQQRYNGGKKSDGEGGEKKTKKNSCKGKCPKKKFMQGKMSENKIHAQDGDHFDMKP